MESNDKDRKISASSSRKNSMDMDVEPKFWKLSMEDIVAMHKQNLELQKQLRETKSEFTTRDIQSQLRIDALEKTLSAKQKSKLEQKTEIESKKLAEMEKLMESQIEIYEARVSTLEEEVSELKNDVKTKTTQIYFLIDKVEKLRKIGQKNSANLATKNQEIINLKMLFDDKSKDLNNRTTIPTSDILFDSVYKKMEESSQDLDTEKRERHNFVQELHDGNQDHIKNIMTNDLEEEVKATKELCFPNSQDLPLSSTLAFDSDNIWKNTEHEEARPQSTQEASNGSQKRVEVRKNYSLLEVKQEMADNVPENAYQAKNGQDETIEIPKEISQNSSSDLTDEENFLENQQYAKADGNEKNEHNANVTNTPIGSNGLNGNENCDSFNLNQEKFSKKDYQDLIEKKPRNINAQESCRQQENLYKKDNPQNLPSRTISLKSKFQPIVKFIEDPIQEMHKTSNENIRVQILTNENQEKRIVSKKDNSVGQQGKNKPQSKKSIPPPIPRSKLNPIRSPSPLKKGSSFDKENATVVVEQQNKEEIFDTTSASASNTRKRIFYADSSLNELQHRKRVQPHNSEIFVGADEPQLRKRVQLPSPELFVDINDTSIEFEQKMNSPRRASTDIYERISLIDKRSDRFANYERKSMDCEENELLHHPEDSGFIDLSGSNSSLQVSKKFTDAVFFVLHNAGKHEFCNRFKKGKCWDGTKCRYLHDDLEITNGLKQAIREFQQYQPLFFVEEEELPRYATEEIQDAIRNSTIRNLCKCFINFHECPNGKNCQYIHDKNQITVGLERKIEERRQKASSSNQIPVLQSSFFQQDLPISAYGLSTPRLDQLQTLQNINFPIGYLNTDSQNLSQFLQPNLSTQSLPIIQRASSAQPNNFSSMQAPFYNSNF